MHFKTHSRKAFTLIELMTVIFIIGILAAVAIPATVKYLRKSKNSEVYLNLRKIYDGEIGYYQEDHTLSSGLLADKQFVGFSPAPSTPGRDKQLGNFTAQGWGAIKFTPDGPVLYSYSVSQSGVNSSSAFTARAQGDIDADGQLSLFERIAAVNGNGDVVGGSAIYSLDPLE